PIYEDEEICTRDGGYGWLVVLGALLIQLNCFGVFFSCKIYIKKGIFQDYYQKNDFRNTPNVTFYLSFVGTLTLAVFDLASPISQVLVSVWGVQVVLILGTLLTTVGLELAAFSTEIWQMCLAQGVLFGMGSSFIYVASMSAVPHWFTNRRGLAFGIVTSGAGIGGLTTPLITDAAISKLGPSWTFRILGFICLGFNTVSCVLIKEKRQANKPKEKLSQIIRFDSLKNTNFVLFLIGSEISLFGYFVPYFILPSYATHLGLSSSQGTSLIAVTSASSFIGRIILGWASDNIGYINADIVANIIAALSCLLIWMVAESYGVLLVFAVVFGSTGGSYYSVISSIPASLIGLEKLPSALTILLVTNSVSEFGTNIASAIQEHTNTPPFFVYKIFTGFAYVLCTVFLILLRLRVNKKLFAKV
ncbi:MFS general substrate transporter, partial [Backusella circina FSU 941]